MVRLIDPALVEVITTLAYEPGNGNRGTGVIIDSTGYVLTNNHVVAGAATVRLRELASGRQYSGTVVGTDLADDLALVRMIGASNLRAARLGDSSAIHVGETVYAIGNGRCPCGPANISPGQITALNQPALVGDEINGEPLELSGLILTDGHVQPGFSGGALADDRGQVIGIVAAGQVPESTDCYSGAIVIPINTAITVARQMMAGIATTRVHIGPTASIGVELAAARDLPDASFVTGALILDIVSGSPADRLGIERGDQVLAIAGQAVHSSVDLARALQNRHPGEAVRVTWADMSAHEHTGIAVLTTGPPQ